MQPVIDYLRENGPRAISELCEYVRFPSVSAQPQHRPDLKACAEWVVKHCQSIGLEARLCPTEGHPIVVAKTPRPKEPARPRPHFVVYGHYDVQPAEPLDLWKSPPFEPRVEGRSLFGRGASDNKGQNLAHLKAVEAYLKTGTELPCDLTFVIEGEEEVGSKSLAGFLKEHRAELRCDAIVISDTGMPTPKHPALTYALARHCQLRGDAARALARPALGHLRRHGGQPGHGLVPIAGSASGQEWTCGGSRFLRRGEAALGLRAEAIHAAALQRHAVPEVPGRAGLVRRAGLHPASNSAPPGPTLEINGLTSGYQGEGSKTIVPAWARAKITVRLVPDQDPRRITNLVVRHLKKLCPPTVRLEINAGHGAEAYLVSPTGPQAQAALRALKLAFGCEPVLLREGGSIPIVNSFKKILRADSLLLGLALPDDNAHSPNEKFDLDCFAKGQLMSAHLWQELSRV